MIYVSFLTAGGTVERTDPVYIHTLESWFLLETDGYSAARSAIDARAADAFFSANSDSINFTTSLR